VLKRSEKRGKKQKPAWLKRREKEMKVGGFASERCC